MHGSWKVSVRMHSLLLRMADDNIAWPLTLTHHGQSNWRLGHSRYARTYFEVGKSCLTSTGALGIPSIGPFPPRHREYSFVNTRVAANVEYAFQALALDEHRKAFMPTLWEQPDGPSALKLLRQCWFPGVHSNVRNTYTLPLGKKRIVD